MLCKSQSDGMKKLMYLCGHVHFLPCFSTPGFELHKKELTLFTIGITVGFCAVSVRANWNVMFSLILKQLPLQIMMLKLLCNLIQNSKFLSWVMYCSLVKFEHDSGPVEQRISANTCSLTLTIAVNKRHTCSGNESGCTKPMSDCPGQVEIQFGGHNLSVGQAHL